MKKKLLIVLIANTMGIVAGFAQQLPQFTQYMFNTSSINPAYAGSRETFSATVLYRDQWSGLEGNPRTITASVHSPLRNQRVGIGFSFIADRLGDEVQNYFYGDFSYVVPLNAKLLLRFGLKAGFTQKKLEQPDYTDPYFDQIRTKWSPNFGAGVHLGTNRWYIGLSTPRILNTGIIDNDEYKAIDRNSYYAIGGLVLDITADIKFKPTTIIKFTNGAPMNFDVTASALFYEKFWAGISYRFNDADAFGAYVDFQLTPKMRVGYAYDIPTATTRPYTSGTHEVLFIYEVNTKKKNKYRSPRYF
ncbi:MAG: type IX secretion system membrane protein PorP/SprF [Flavobacteriaceae bacterium]|nr:type IX secretion system membrane protein PorP/SprF [Flavobacteriaceae bacterium]